MKSLKYKLNTDIISRTAIQLNWSLNRLNSSIYIVNKDNRKVNGKSLVGILSGHLQNKDIITIYYEDENDMCNIKELFNEIGREL